MQLFIPLSSPPILMKVSLFIGYVTSIKLSRRNHHSTIKTSHIHTYNMCKIHIPLMQSQCYHYYLIQSNPIQSNKSSCDNFFTYVLAPIIQRGVLVHSSILCMSSWVHYSRTHLLTTVGTLPLVYE